MDYNEFILGFTFYKSMRKNAMTESISVFHFDNTDEITDTDKFITALSSAIGKMIKLHTHDIIVSADIYHRTNAHIISNDTPINDYHVFVKIEKRKCSGIRDLLDYIYNVYMTANYTSTLSLNTLCSNPSIKYYFKQWKKYQDGFNPDI